MSGINLKGNEYVKKGRRTLKAGRGQKERAWEVEESSEIEVKGLSEGRS